MLDMRLGVRRLGVRRLGVRRLGVRMGCFISAINKHRK